MTDLRRTPLRRLLLLSALMGGASLVEDTATGNPVTFETDVAKPLVSLEIPFTPVQSGTGDPSPENIRSILPWNGLTVFGGGKNLFDVSTVVKGTLDGTGALVANDNRRTSAFITLTAGKYKISRNAIVDWWKVWTYELDGTPIQKVYDGNDTNFTLTITEFCKIRISFDYVVTAENEVQLEVGQTATAYEPYKPITETDIVFHSPVYGGTLDVVSGVMTVEYPTDEVSLDTLYFYMASDGNFVFMNLPFTFGDRAKIVCNSYKTVEFPYWNSMPDLSIMGSPSGDQIFRIRNDAFTDETSFRNHLTEIGAKIVYPLATPTEQTLTGHQLTAPVGDNTIWSDADGRLTAVYLKKA